MSQAPEWLSRAILLLQWARYRFGALGLAGLLLLAGSVAYGTAASIQYLHDTASLRSEFALLKRSGMAGGAIEARTLTLHGEENFPSVTQMPGTVLEIMRLAEAQALPINAATYSLTPATAATPAQYEMTFKTTGRYASIREFVQGVLNTQPAIALRDMRFARIKDQPGQVEAGIRLVVFLKPWGTS